MKQAIISSMTTIAPGPATGKSIDPGMGGLAPVDVKKRFNKVVLE